MFATVENRRHVRGTRLHSRTNCKDVDGSIILGLDLCRPRSPPSLETPPDDADDEAHRTLRRGPRLRFRTVAAEQDARVRHTPAHTHTKKLFRSSSTRLRAAAVGTGASHTCLLHLIATLALRLTRAPHVHSNAGIFVLTDNTTEAVNNTDIKCADTYSTRAGRGTQTGWAIASSNTCTTRVLITVYTHSRFHLSERRAISHSVSPLCSLSVYLATGEVTELFLALVARVVRVDPAVLNSAVEAPDLVANITLALLRVHRLAQLCNQPQRAHPSVESSGHKTRRMDEGR